MKLKINNRFTGELIVEGDFGTLAELVCDAVRKKLNLRGADLRSADLRSADLRGADLSGADLSSADLRSADLRSADLRGADLRSADLRGADLKSTKNASLAIARTRILPEGDLIGWKKCSNEECSRDVIVKLHIPAAAKRSHAFGRKCRAEFAKVLEVIGAEIGHSTHDRRFTYEAGKTVKPHKWSDEWTEECAGGIHFFITREEAEAYS